MILFICGKSGSGKDTIVQNLLREYEIYSKLPIYTTCPKRKGEIDGKEYIFLSENDFIRKSYNNEFLESRMYTTAFGVWRYATKYPDKDGVYILSGPIDMLKDVCFRGKHMNIFKVYIDAPAKQRLNRSLNRISHDESVIECCRRIYQDDVDFKNMDLNMFDLVLSK